MTKDEAEHLIDKIIEATIAKLNYEVALAFHPEDQVKLEKCLENTLITRALAVIAIKEHLP